MDILRNLFGNVTSGIIRLAVTAGVLFLCYLFIVKPVLDTTTDAIHSSGLDQIGKTLNTVNVQVQRQIRRSFRATKAQGGNPQKLVKCIKRAKQNVEKIERCTRRF
ncbi:MAG TPA: hypothetical protein VHQ43_07760 [Solirubrobacterales bacterium]|jgi:maltooligosyltrehalose synthase|nr:hypothetical protein [Solirubrobacterales bacterium]